MVKGNESLFVSYTWWESVPNPTEKARLQHIGAIFLSYDIKMYADIVDPTFDEASYLNSNYVLENSRRRMSESTTWLAIIANKHQQSLLLDQAREARARDMTVILAYQDEMEGSLPPLEELAIKHGAIYFWENDRDLREIVREEVVPMCDNSTNDCNTIWTSQRKTA